MTTLYELIIRDADTGTDRRTLLSLARAGAVYDNGWIDVRFGSIVYENDITRLMTEDDRRAISRAADAYSESK